MYEPVLAPSKAKASIGERSALFQQPFPVPIASLTEIKASNSIWRWYQGIWTDTNKCVLVQNGGETIKNMGFFGTDWDAEDHPRKREQQQSQEEEDMIEIVDLIPSPLDPSPIKTRDKDLERKVDQKAKTKAPPPEGGPVALQLQDFEAFFLSYALGCLIVEDSRGREMNLDQMWALFVVYRPRFPFLYAVYHHFRAKGWVVKPGAHFGADFMLYKDGPPFYHAAYSVKVVMTPQLEHESSDELSWQDLAGLNRMTESASKELILAQVSVHPDLLKEAGGWELSPECLKKLSVKEILVRRWVPSQERED